DCVCDGFSMAVIGSGPAKSGAVATATASAATTATATAATAYPATAPATCRTDCALSRRLIGAGSGRFDLSAGSGNGRALVRKESGSQRCGARRLNAEAALGSEREGINVSSAGADDDERKAGLDQSAR